VLYAFENVPVSLEIIHDFLLKRLLLAFLFFGVFTEFTKKY